MRKAAQDHSFADSMLLSLQSHAWAGSCKNQICISAGSSFCVTHALQNDRQSLLLSKATHDRCNRVCHTGSLPLTWLVDPFVALSCGSTGGSGGCSSARTMMFLRWERVVDTVKCGTDSLCIIDEVCMVALHNAKSRCAWVSLVCEVKKI